MKRLLRLLALAALPLVLLACSEEEPAVTDVTTATAEGGTPLVERTASPTPASVATSTPAGAASPGGTAVPGTQVSPPVETPIPAATETVTSTYTIPTSQLPRVRFAGADGPVQLPVEVPPRSEYAIGLSGRTSLEGRGMVFYREDFGQTGFWMQNTHIDLDIAFVDDQGEILFITTMFADTRDIHRPDAPYVVAIEAPAGWYAANGIAEGGRVEYLFDLEATVTD
ncbi:MAG: DUF192 domain-containing protein [Dehalococcoidia bacterium]